MKQPDPKSVVELSLNRLNKLDGIHVPGQGFCSGPLLWDTEKNLLQVLEVPPDLLAISVSSTAVKP